MVAARVENIKHRMLCVPGDVINTIFCNVAPECESFERVLFPFGSSC